MATRRMATSMATSSLTKQPANHHRAASTTTSAASTSATTASFYHHSSPPQGSQQQQQYSSTHGQQIPNRLTQAYHEMQEVCPNSISVYAACVLETEQRSQTILSQHSCSKEFKQVKDCFRKIRRL